MDDEKIPETRRKYGWIAGLVASAIITVGQGVAAIFQIIFSILSALARKE